VSDEIQKDAMMAFRWLLLTMMVVAAGCSSSADPWHDYLVAQEILENEQDFERRAKLHYAENPSPDSKALLERATAQADRAAARLKTVRERLPK
jgi:hypothetical protein